AKLALRHGLGGDARQAIYECDSKTAEDERGRRHDPSGQREPEQCEHEAEPNLAAAEWPQAAEPGSTLAGERRADRGHEIRRRREVDIRREVPELLREVLVVRQPRRGHRGSPGPAAIEDVSSARSRPSARDNRDFAVPGGQSSAIAVSASLSPRK